MDNLKRNMGINCVKRSDSEGQSFIQGGCEHLSPAQDKYSQRIKVYYSYICHRRCSHGLFVAWVVSKWISSNL